MVAELVAFGCGSWREVERGMGLRQYRAMWRHWAKLPPLNLLVANHFGWKPPKAAPVNQDSAVEQLFALFGGAPEPGKPVTLR